MRDFLSDCHKIETMTGQIYQQLSTDQSYSKDIRATFKSLCNDEQSHARQIDLVMQTPEQELDAVNQISWERVNMAVQLVEQMFAKINLKRLNEEEALRLAIEMEEQFVKIHVHNSLKFDNPRLSALFAELGSHDQIHVNLLRECIQRWHQIRRSMQGG